jgi:hypothetical protein
MRSTAPVFSTQEARKLRQDSVPGSTDIHEFLQGLHKVWKSWAIGQGSQYLAYEQTLPGYY